MIRGTPRARRANPPEAAVLGNSAAPQSARGLPLYALLGAASVSTLGNVLTFVAVPWFVLQTTGSAAKTGLTGGAIALGAVLAGIFGGPVVDRLGAKRSSIVADLASGATVASIPLLHQLGALSFWQLLALVFLGSFLDVPGSTARESLIPGLAEAARMPIERANSAYQAINQFSMLLGPPLAGVLIVTLGASNVLWLDAATFAACAVTIAAFVPRLSGSAAQEEAVARPRHGYLASLAEGLSFVLRDRLIFLIVGVAVVTNFLIDPLSSVVLPVFSEAVYGSAVDLGIMLSGFGGGSLVGALLYGIAAPRLPRRWTFAVAFAAAGLPLWVLIATPGLLAATAALFLMGLASGPINPLLYTVLQERTPGSMLARVLGTFTALAMAAMPAGTVVAGLLIEVVGLRNALAAIASAYSIVALIVVLNPALGKMDEGVVPDTKEGDAKSVSPAPVPHAGETAREESRGGVSE